MGRDKPVDAPRFERYSSVPLFEGLQPEEIGALLGYSEQVEVEPGAVVIQEGCRVKCGQ